MESKGDPISGWGIRRGQTRRASKSYCSFAYSALACFRMGMPGLVRLPIKLLPVSLNVADQCDIAFCVGAGDGEVATVKRPTKVRYIVRLKAGDELS